MGSIFFVKLARKLRWAFYENCKASARMDEFFVFLVLGKLLPRAGKNGPKFLLFTPLKL